MAVRRLREGWGRPGGDPQSRWGRPERRRRDLRAFVAACTRPTVCVSKLKNVGDHIEIACPMCVMASVPECSYAFYNSIAWC